MWQTPQAFEAFLSPFCPCLQQVLLVFSAIWKRLQVKASCSKFPDVARVEMDLIFGEVRKDAALAVFPAPTVLCSCSVPPFSAPAVSRGSHSSLPELSWLLWLPPPPLWKTIRQFLCVILFNTSLCMNLSVTHNRNHIYALAIEAWGS